MARSEIWSKIRSWENIISMGALRKRLCCVSGVDAKEMASFHWKLTEFLLFIYFLYYNIHESYNIHERIKKLRGSGSLGAEGAHLHREFKSLFIDIKFHGAFDFYAPHPYSALLTRKKSLHWRSKGDTPQGLTPNSLATSLCVRYNRKRIKAAGDRSPVPAF